MPFTVYGIFDPRLEDRNCFYVGQTNDLSGRSAAHLKAEEFDGNIDRVTRIKTLLAEGKAPRFEVLGACRTVLEADERERYWIQKLRQEGHQLTNLTEGGRGGGTISARAPETEWIRTAYALRCATEAMARISPSLLGAKNSNLNKQADRIREQTLKLRLALEDELNRLHPEWKHLSTMFLDDAHRLAQRYRDVPDSGLPPSVSSA